MDVTKDNNKKENLLRYDFHSLHTKYPKAFQIESPKCLDQACVRVHEAGVDHDSHSVFSERMREKAVSEERHITASTQHNTRT